MTAYWIDTPVTWAADHTLHAGITRQAMQDNAQVSYEQSGHDIDSFPMDATALTHALPAGPIWTRVYDTFLPQPIPVYAIQGGGWRAIGFDLRAKVSVGVATVRIYLLGSWGGTTILDTATGAIGEVTSYKEFTINNAYARKGGDVTLDDVGSGVFRSLLAPMVGIWMVAISNQAGGAVMSIEGLRIQEHS